MSGLRFGHARAAVIGVTLAALLTARPGLAQQGPSAEDRAAARTAASQGGEHYQAGRYAEALDLFSRAEALVHAPTHVLMLARTHAALGQLLLAQEAYLKVTREELPANAPPAFKRARDEAQAELTDLSAKIPTLQVSIAGAAPKGLVVTMNDKPVPAAMIGLARPVDPGTYVIRARGEGVSAKDQTITVKAGDRQTITLELAAGSAAPATPPLAPAPTPLPGGEPRGADAKSSMSPVRIAGFAMLGAGAVGLGIGAAFGVLSIKKRGEADDAFAACGTGCSGAGANVVRQLDEDANGKGNVFVAGMIAGSALAIGGVVMVIVGKPKAAKSTGAVVSPWIGAGQAGVVGRF